jgi:hypothetical protein
MGLVKGSVDQLMKAKVDRVFMPHGLGHHLGLDVHDMAEEGPVPVKLQPGYVVTCEPGCYFMPMLIERALADKDQVQRAVQGGGCGTSASFLAGGGGPGRLIAQSFWLVTVWHAVVWCGGCSDSLAPDLQCNACCPSSTTGKHVHLFSTPKMNRWRNV